ncbi:MAG TPA: polysaccharide pyruvyl transferase family protein, partial [Thermoanaerobaculia bacterium]|nr:polysaccharide pyruvyl transferase family protein [Thermoanaerobaculia bacterium]
MSSSRMSNSSHAARSPAGREGNEEFGPRIGYWSRGNLGRFAEVLRPWIFEREIGRRIPGARVQAYAPLGPRHRAAVGGAPVVADLGQWTPARTAELADALDCVVIGGQDVIQSSDALLAADYGPDADEASRSRPAAFFIEGLGEGLESRCPVAWDAVSLPADVNHATARRLQEAAARRTYLSVRDSASKERLARAGVEADVAVVPDPLLLLPRLFSPALLLRRLEFARHMQWFPPEGRPLPVVLQGGRALVKSAESIADAIAEAVSGSGLPLVLLDLDPDAGDGEFVDAVAHVLNGPVYRIPSDASLEDRVAALAHSQAFVGSSGAGALVASAFGTPSLVIDVFGEASQAPSDPSSGRISVVCGLSGLPGALERLLASSRHSAGIPAELEERLNAHFDALARAAGDAFVRRLRDSGDPVPVLLSRLREIERQMETWRVAWEARNRQVVEGRLQMAGILESKQGEWASRLDLLSQELSETQSERDSARMEAARLSTDPTGAWKDRELARVRELREEIEGELEGAAAEVARLRSEHERTAENIGLLRQDLDAARREAAVASEEGERRARRAESSIVALRAELERAEANLEAFRAREAELRVSETLLFAELAEARSDASRSMDRERRLEDSLRVARRERDGPE